MRDTPKIEDAPGLHWKPRKDAWEARWECRPDIAKKGYIPKSAALWVGTAPSELERKMIADACNRLQNEMLVFNAGGVPIVGNGFDGTLRNLISIYQTDVDSRYHKLRYHVRRNHDDLLKRIIRRHGDVQIAEIKARVMLSWHKLWTDDGKKIPTGRAFIGMLRTLFAFGKTILEDAECARISSVMSDMRFPISRPRTVMLTARHAVMIISECHTLGWDSIALAQAAQFEGTMRQKDIIGEWVPLNEPGLSEVTHPRFGKWLRGLRWEEIDDNLILRHTTSKKEKPIVVDLKLAPMVLLQFERQFTGSVSYRIEQRGGKEVKVLVTDRSQLPSMGPVIVDPVTGLPFTPLNYRRRWRAMADRAGVPKTVWSMDSRSGAISEAVTAGASLDLIRHAAAHSQVGITARYDRASEENTATVMQLRAKHRIRGTDEGRE